MESNSDTDIDVLTKFHHMPKRFMVWDKENQQFCRERLPNDVIKEIFDIFELQFWIGNLDEDETDDFIIFQSTNLFDKDGKEIFEGHIVRVGGETGIVQMVRGEWHAMGDDDIPLSVWEPSGIEILGHILSNPELLEEK